MNKSFIIWDLDGTLVRLKGAWVKVHEMIAPHKNVVDACADKVRIGGQTCEDFMEELSNLELSETPEPLFALRTCVSLEDQQFICSNNTRMTVKSVIQRHDLPISGFIGIDDVNYGKPSPEGIKRLLNEHNLDIKYGLFVGNAKTDKEAAQALGLHFMDVKTINGGNTR